MTLPDNHALLPQLVFDPIGRRYLYAFASKVPTNIVEGMEFPDGSRRWWWDFKPHRTDGPAVVNRDGFEEWWLDGRRHRLDRPARLTSDVAEWWVDGRLHRIGGPARRWRNGDEEWYEGGLRHRIGGPSMLNLSGRPHETREEWRVRDKYHRVDGPAITTFTGSELWLINNVLINKEVDCWISDHELDRDWRTWDGVTWCLFRLRFEQ